MRRSLTYKEKGCTGGLVRDRFSFCINAELNRSISLSQLDTTSRHSTAAIIRGVQPRPH